MLQVNQLPQTSYQALQTPYAFFGLGRTNNYIENLFVGSTKHQSDHFINMEGVIPNSRVVIIPPANANSNGIQDWRRELYLRPGEWIPWVTLTVIVATVILAIVVFFLHMNEKVSWCYILGLQKVPCSAEPLLVSHSAKTNWNDEENSITSTLTRCDNIRFILHRSTRKLVACIATRLTDPDTPGLCCTLYCQNYACENLTTPLIGNNASIIFLILGRPISNEINYEFIAHTFLGYHFAKNSLPLYHGHSICVGERPI